MAKHKLTELEINIKNYIPPVIDSQLHKSVSYSQYSVYMQCPYRWNMEYALGNKIYTDSINTVFGTATHETLQYYLEVLYNESGAAADRLDLEIYLEERLKECYRNSFLKTNVHFSNQQELREFYDDGIEIIRWIKKNRTKIFTTRNVRLLGIEIPIIQEIKDNIYLKGFIDVVLYDLDLDKVYIIDFKTSRASWTDGQKKDELKQHQLLIYKHYFSKQFDYPESNIEVKFIILKRKLWENCDYPQQRIQNIIPASGKSKINKCLSSFDNFLKECFDELGKPIVKTYLKKADKKTCQYCPYSKDVNLCNKKNTVSA